MHYIDTSLILDGQQLCESQQQENSWSSEPNLVSPLIRTFGSSSTVDIDAPSQTPPLSIKEKPFVSLYYFYCMKNSRACSHVTRCGDTSGLKVASSERRSRCKCGSLQSFDNESLQPSLSQSVPLVAAHYSRPLRPLITWKCVVANVKSNKPWYA